MSRIPEFPLNVETADFIFKLADPAEREAALALRKEVYLRELGYVSIDPCEDRAFHPVVLAKPRGEVVASAAILGPELRPFEIEKYLNIDEILGPGRRPAMTGRLCIRPDFRKLRTSVPLLWGILYLTYAVALSRDFTDVLMYTTITRLRVFYEKGMFRLLDTSFFHPGRGLPAYVMNLDVAALKARLSDGQSPLLRFLMSFAAGAQRP